MKRVNLILTCVTGAILLLASPTVWAPQGGPNDLTRPRPTKDEIPAPPAGAELFFWRWGHMDGPHTSSMAQGISRDGKTAVGQTVVVDFERAWRSDIDWAIATDDGLPPLYNELQVQEDIGVIAPSRPSAAYAASDMSYVPVGYDRPSLNLDWGGSTVVGTYTLGTVSYGIQWMLPVLDSVDDGDYVAIADFGGGAASMQAMDVTSDGHVMVGYGNNQRGPMAFRADMSDPLLPVLKTLTIADFNTAQTLQWSRAEAVSGDGLRVAGFGGTKRGNRAFVAEVLDPGTDPITLLSVVLPNIDGGRFAEAYAMTPDGAVIAGRSDSPQGPQACIWFVDGTTGEWVVKGLGGLTMTRIDSVATGVAYRPGSEAGELMVVGRSKSILYPSEAFVWAGNPVLEDDEIGYKYDLEYILIKTGAAEYSGMGSRWILNEATGLSAAGDRIVGWGVNPEGGIEAWVVTGYPYDVPVFTHD